jgi:hypothetical protein
MQYRFFEKMQHLIANQIFRKNTLGKFSGIRYYSQAAKIAEN